MLALASAGERARGAAFRAAQACAPWGVHELGALERTKRAAKLGHARQRARDAGGAQSDERMMRGYQDSLIAKCHE